MDGRTDGRTDGQTDGRTYKWTDEQTDGRTFLHTYVRTYERTYVGHLTCVHVHGAQLRTDHEEILATAVAEAVEVARAEAVEVALAEAAEAHAADAHAAEAHASQLSSEAAPEWTERLPLGSTPWATMAAGLEVSRPFGPSGGFMDSARHPLDSPSPLQNASCALLSDTAAAIAPRVLRGPTLAF